MLSIVKRNGVYYIRVRVPADVRKHFPAGEVVRSLHTGLYRQAKSLARGKLGALERVFMTIRAGVLSDDEIQKLVEKYKREWLDKSETDVDLMAAGWGSSFKDGRQMLAELWTDQEDLHKHYLLNERGLDEQTVYTALELIGKKPKDEGIYPDEFTSEFKKLCRAVALANKEVYTTILERNETGSSAYDRQELAKPKSHTLKELIDRYTESMSNKDKSGRLPEKLTKISECFKFETGKEDMPLAEIDYDLTLKVGRRLMLYPCHRKVTYKDMTLEEIYKLKGVQYPKNTVVKKELGVLTTVFDYAMKKLEGLRKNYAVDLAAEIISTTTEKESDVKDDFRACDIQEIVRVLGVYKDKGEFKKNPHLLFITLIGLFSGARINEICQLQVNDLVQVDGLWCFKHRVIDADENQSEEKRLKNKNSIRTNPVHPTLIDLGLIRFRDAQAAKGYTGLWEGSKQHSCEYYPLHKNCSSYVGKWWNRTFKKKLTLSNPKKQTYHSTRHSFINWFYQHITELDYMAASALSGHLDKEDLAVMERRGYDPKAESVRTYVKNLNVRRQMDLLEKLDYGVDLSGLRIN